MFGNQFYPQYGQQMQYPQGYFLPNNGAMPDQLAQLRGAGQQQAQAQTVPPQGGGVQSPITWVQGEAGAKSYLVAPGNTVMLMDSEADVFYIKAADASGVPMPLRTFDYKERTTEAAQHAAAQAPSYDMSRYITREEFEEFRASMAEAKQAQPAAKRVTKTAEVESDGE